MKFAQSRLGSLTLNIEKALFLSTQYSFNSMKVLTVQNVIAKNVLISIPYYAPNYKSMHENLAPNLRECWFRTSIFYKGPLLKRSAHTMKI